MKAEGTKEEEEQNRKNCQGEKKRKAAQTEKQRFSYERNDRTSEAAATIMTFGYSLS
jgi:hypothetical protein